MLLGGLNPSENDGVRQLGWWHSQYDGKNENVATNQYVFLCFDVTLASKYGDVWHGHRKKLEFQEQNVDSKILSNKNWDRYKTNIPCKIMYSKYRCYWIFCQQM